MASWYKVRFPSSEPDAPAKGVRLQNDYSRIYVRHRGPKDALLMANGARDEYYFSPGAMCIAEALVLASGGTACDRPQRSQVSLLVGSIHWVDRILPRTE
jgi:hypothetical protein